MRNVHSHLEQARDALVPQTVEVQILDAEERAVPVRAARKTSRIIISRPSVTLN